MWSSEKILREKQIAENVDTRALVDAIRQLSEINPVVSGNELLRKHDWTPPDMVVIYLVSGLSTSAFRFHSQDSTAIKSVVSRAHDSQTAAYFYQDASDSLEAALSAATHTSAPLQPEQVSQWFRTAAAAGRTHVIVVRCADLQQADEAVALVDKALVTSEQSFVAVLTAASAVFADAYVVQTDVPVFASLSQRVLRDDPNDTTSSQPTPTPSADCVNTTCYDTYFPPDVSSGLLVSALLVIIMIVAMCAMSSLQSPERFEGAQKRVFISRVQPR